MRKLITELNRAIFSKGFLAAAVGTSAVLCIGAYDSFKLLIKTGAAMETGLHATALMTALASDTMLMALPVLAALPCTAGFVEDWKSGYIKNCLPREGRQGYINAKAAASALAGALAILMGILAAYIFFTLVFLPMEKAAPADMPSMFPMILGKAIMLTLCGALWSVVGLALSTATLSTHMAYASPFIVYYVLVILATRYFPDVSIINPEEWLKPEHLWPGGDWGVALLIAEMMVLAIILFGASASRRLKNE